MGSTQPPRRRRRGVILSSQGREKLQAAKSAAEFQDNDGRRYTLEALSERTSLAVDTLMKVLAGEVGVDKQSLKYCFQAFGLTLKNEDYMFPPAPQIQQDRMPSEPELEREAEPPIPGGMVPLKSNFYIDPIDIKTACFRTVLRPGSLIRIKGARRIGKTSLAVRISDYATKLGCCTVFLSFQWAEKKDFGSLDRLLRWFSASVGLGMDLQPAMNDYWDELFGSKVSCKLYFEQYLLSSNPQPIVLILDDIDRLFEYPEIADDFFSLLRVWHEEGKNRDIWQKLRMVVVHTSEVYIPLNLNRSPFNVGLLAELTEFTLEQVQILAQRYQINWSMANTKMLMSLLGGQPYLIQLTLYHLWHGDIQHEDIEQAMSNIPAIFQEHLQRQLWILQQRPALVEAFTQVIAQKNAVELPLAVACSLQNMGLVKLQDNRAKVSCQLYANYFIEQLL